jgi:hypothetical protein
LFTAQQGQITGAKRATEHPATRTVATQERELKVKHRVLAVIVAPAVAALAAVMFSTSAASAHEILVVCDQETGHLVWSNTTPDSVPGTVVTSNGLSVEVPAHGSVTTEHPGPGTWTVTWTNGETAEGAIPPVCTEVTTTSAPTTTAAPTSTAPPTTAPTLATSPPAAPEAGVVVAGVTAVPPAESSGAETLPATGSDASIAALACVLIAAGAAALLIARRSVRT